MSQTRPAIEARNQPVLADLQDGTEPARRDRGRRPRALGTPRPTLDDRRMAQDGADREQLAAPVAVTIAPSSVASAASTRRIEIGHRASGQHVQEMASRRRRRDPARRADRLHVEPIVGGDELGRASRAVGGARRTARPAARRTDRARSGTVAGQRAVPPDRAPPTSGTSPPDRAGASRRCGTRTPAPRGEDLDLALRAQHHRDVAAARAWRARARRTSARTGTASEALAARRFHGPALHVDDVDEPSVAPDQEHRAHAVGETEEALDRGQRARVVRPVALGTAARRSTGSCSVPSSSTPVEIGWFS